MGASCRTPRLCSHSTRRTRYARGGSLSLAVVLADARMAPSLRDLSSVRLWFLVRNHVLSRPLLVALLITSLHRSFLALCVCCLLSTSWVRKCNMLLFVLLAPRSVGRQASDQSQNATSLLLLVAPSLRSVRWFLVATYGVDARSSLYYHRSAVSYGLKCCVAPALFGRYAL